MLKKFLYMLMASFACLSATTTFFKDVEESSAYLKEKVSIHPELLVVLTGGIEGLEDLLTNKIIISSKDIPHFPKAHAQGHAGQLIFGMYQGKGVVLMKGRFHYYEGLEPSQVVFPYCVLEKLGVKKMITTNAVGGIRHDLNAGDIVLIKDHINYMGENPLRGIAIHTTHQFPSMTACYDPDFAKLAKESAEALKIPLREGVYIATMGPSYETKSEIKMFRSFGADVVGMSTLFEVITCSFLKIKVLAFSCVTNVAADRYEGNMNHEEVLAAMSEMGPRLKTLIEECMKKMLK